MPYPKPYRIEMDKSMSVEGPKEPGGSRITVVIPFFNQIEKLSFTAKSLAEQDLRPETVIFVDDRGNDRMDPQIIEMLEKAGIHAFVLMNERNLGPGGSRQAGMEKAPPDTEFLHFLDSDDSVSPSFFSESVKVHRANPGIIVTYGDTIQQKTGKSRMQGFKPPNSLLDGILCKRMWGTGSLLWKYEAIKDIRWKTWRSIEDSDFELSAAIRNTRVAFVPEAKLFVDQSLDQDRMKTRNRMGTHIGTYLNRQLVLTRLLIEYPFGREREKASLYVDVACYQLAQVFTGGPMDYLRLIANFLSRGETYTAARLVYRTPRYYVHWRRKLKLYRWE